MLFQTFKYVAFSYFESTKGRRGPTTAKHTAKVGESPVAALGTTQQTPPRSFRNTPSGSQITQDVQHRALLEHELKTLLKSHRNKKTAA